ncbi:type II toxin-antitoxin system RelB/DinJ family antitoxin [Selenomonas sp.]|uniref:type II toxin-antitoxin system RelB/DinJ family antitoxin n=1 Tax=Selenomonas sp. TaxID=2053611 RepID=UPI002600DCBA|nr:hypothetical protein [Selenomonas sp.]MCI6084864.1 type II toxin-antitoxin system RelB/DinJ family antitoxin [Selenomonas sp.]MDY3296320.1 hypothetical protein [Selenomonas sp.]MDY4415866.1 hypothetical protein [Selenomonas sp.]
MATATATANKMNFTFKLDRNLRDQFNDVCEGLGISMSAALTAFVKQTIRQQGVSFSLLDENGFSPADAAELSRRVAEIRSGKAKFHHHELIEVDG